MLAFNWNACSYNNYLISVLFIFMMFSKDNGTINTIWKMKINEYEARIPSMRNIVIDLTMNWKTNFKSQCVGFNKSDRYMPRNCRTQADSQSATSTGPHLYTHSTAHVLAASFTFKCMRSRCDCFVCFSFLLNANRFVQSVHLPMRWFGYTANLWLFYSFCGLATLETIKWKIKTRQKKTQIAKPIHFTWICLCALLFTSCVYLSIELLCKSRFREQQEVTLT